MFTVRLVRIISIVVLSFLMLVFIGCERVAAEKDYLLIVATIYPYELLLRELVLENAEVVSVIPPSASPHTYSPTPEDMKKLEDADLIVSNGAELEVYLDSALMALAGKHVDSYSIIGELLQSDKTLINSHSVDQSHHNHSHHGDEHKHDSHSHHINPHFWLDPVLITHIAAGISDKLIAIDPDNEEAYRDNLSELNRKLLSLSDRIENERKELRQVSILNFHDAFYYFNNRFKVHSAGVIVQSPGREPTPAELANVGRQITKHNVKAIFVEPQLNPKAAQVIAAEFGLKLLTVDPIGSKESVHSISELIEQNWKVIKQALSV